MRSSFSGPEKAFFFVLGAGIASSVAVQGAALHIVMHAAGKITLFFCAGAIYVQAHVTKISDLNGQGREMPWVFAAFFIGALSIIGIPPLGGSWSKFMLMVGAVDSGYYFILGVLGISSLLNIYYLLEPVSRGFFCAKMKSIEVSFHPLVVMPPIITAILSVLLFFYVDFFAAITELMVIS